MINIFHSYIYEPIFAVLIFIYENAALGDLGLAIIILTLLVRIILFPIFWKSAKDQALMARLQPHIKRIQLDHKNNKEEQAKQLMALYREHRLNPLSGFLLLLIQLPILIALYRVFLQEITTDVFSNISFLGILNLSERSLILAVVAATLQYFQSKISLPKRESQEKGGPLANVAKMGRTMVVIGPVVTFFILINFPSALGIYWTTSVLFSLGQQVIINKRLPKIEHDGKHARDDKKHARADGIQQDSG